MNISRPEGSLNPAQAKSSVMVEWNTKVWKKWDWRCAEESSTRVGILIVATIYLQLIQN